MRPVRRPPKRCRTSPRTNTKASRLLGFRTIQASFPRAKLIRDQALALGGLGAPRIYSLPVSPYWKCRSTANQALILAKDPCPSQRCSRQSNRSGTRRCARARSPECKPPARTGVDFPRRPRANLTNVSYNGGSERGRYPAPQECLLLSRSSSLVRDYSRPQLVLRIGRWLQSVRGVKLVES